MPLVRDQMNGEPIRSRYGGRPATPAFQLGLTAGAYRVPAPEDRKVHGLPNFLIFSGNAFFRSPHSSVLRSHR